MKAYFLWTVQGPRLILTCCDFTTNRICLEVLAHRGIDKFVAQEVALHLAKDRYGTHFDIVMKDPKQTDDLRILDEVGERVLKNFSLKELGTPIYYEEKS